MVILALTSLLAACGGPSVTAPLQVSDEHPGFARCAAQSHMTPAATTASSDVTADGRAAALENCLAGNKVLSQVAERS